MKANELSVLDIQATAARFAERVLSGPPDLCWPWRLKVDRDGYGVYSMAGTRVPAHRLAWAIHAKSAMPVGMVVMHTCDNPRCCNPRHLVMGSQRDNIADRDAKGRTPRGRSPMPTQEPAPQVAGLLDPASIPRYRDSYADRADRAPRSSKSASEVLADILRAKAERMANRRRI